MPERYAGMKERIRLLKTAGVIVEGRHIFVILENPLCSYVRPRCLLLMPPDLHLFGLYKGPFR